MNNAQILVVDDEANIRELLDEILSEEGYEVTTAADAEHARSARRDQSFDLVLLDIWMPDTDGITLLKEWADSGALGSVVMMSGHGTVDTAVEATRLGALDFIEKPVSLTKLLRTVNKVLSAHRSRDIRHAGIATVLAPIGKSEPMRNLRQQLQRVGEHDTPVLLTGEPGSGRKLCARYLCSHSSRAAEPFEIVSGRDLTDENADLLLCGSEAQAGLFERVNGGTLFIDSVDQAGQHAQRILQAAMQSGRFARPGTATTETLDLRILASAPAGFERDQNFRADLLALLGGVIVRVPPLREYSEDVPELLRSYADLLVDEERLPFRRFSIAAQNRLRNYPWPGNVRELRNVVKRLLIMAGDEEIGLLDVEAELSAKTPQSEPLVKLDLLAMPLREAREHFERAYLQQQLLICEGKVGQLAKRVGMERTHLYRKLRALGVDFRQVGPED